LELAEGMEMFAKSYEDIRNKLQISNDPFELTSLLVEFITQEDWVSLSQVSSLKNFDGWSLTHNVDVEISNYMPHHKRSPKF
jgi:hypothetical protein